MEDLGAGYYIFLGRVLHDRAHRDGEVFGGGLHNEIVKRLAFRKVIEEIGCSSEGTVDGSSEHDRHQVTDSADGAVEVISVSFEEVAFNVESSLDTIDDIAPSILSLEGAITEEPGGEPVVLLPSFSQVPDAIFGEFLDAEEVGFPHE